MDLFNLFNDLKDQTQKKINGYENEEQKRRFLKKEIAVKLESGYILQMRELMNEDSIEILEEANAELDNRLFNYLNNTQIRNARKQIIDAIASWSNKHGLE